MWRNKQKLKKSKSQLLINTANRQLIEEVAERRKMVPFVLDSSLK